MLEVGRHQVVPPVQDIPEVVPPGQGIPEVVPPVDNILVEAGLAELPLKTE